MDVLQIQAGFVTSVQSLEEGSRLLVMADYLFGALQDEYQYDANYFK